MNFDRSTSLVFVAACLLGTPLFVHGQPSISSFTPLYGAPGDLVRIYGSGFSPGALAVRFNGVLDPTAQATAQNQIQALVPNGATTGPISVSVGGGSSVYSLVDFIIIGAGPYVVSFSPTFGSASTEVAISGAHFTGAHTVLFDGVAATSFYVETDGSIRAFPPANVTTGPITVSGPKGTSTTTNLFHANPAITSFSPPSGRTGTNILVRGKNFLGTTAVTLSGMNAAFQVRSNTGMIVTVPEGATTGGIRVFAPAGSTPPTPNFTVLPTIYGFDPPGGPRGSSVVITGANFNVGTTTVRFNGVTASKSGLTFNQVTAVVPGAATTGFITIQTGDGTSGSSSMYYVTPEITSFSRSNGAPGTWVTINGLNFTGVTNVTFGGVPADFTITNNTTIGATVPVGVVTGPISVSHIGGTATSSSMFYGNPVIAQFLPMHGLPGTNVTVIGTNFLGATAVRFNGLNGNSLSVANNGRITISVPEGAQAGPISVVTPGGTAVSVEPFILDYVDLSVRIQSSPPYVFTGSNFSYSIVVSNSGPANAPDVVVTNRFLAGIELLSAQVSQGSIQTEPPPIVGQLGYLAAGGSASIDLGVIYRGTGSVVTVAGAYAAQGYLDQVPANNSASLTNTVYPPAVLSIARETNIIEVSWPSMLSNFIIQSSSGLSPTNVWGNIVKGRTNTGTANVLVDTNLGGTKFYRLRSP